MGRCSTGFLQVCFSLARVARPPFRAGRLRAGTMLKWPRRRRRNGAVFDEGWSPQTEVSLTGAKKGRIRASWEKDPLQLAGTRVLAEGRALGETMLLHDCEKDDLGGTKDGLGALLEIAAAFGAAAWVAVGFFAVQVASKGAQLATSDADLDMGRGFANIREVRQNYDQVGVG